jgi:hypothetical protein
LAPDFEENTIAARLRVRGPADVGGEEPEDAYHLDNWKSSAPAEVMQQAAAIKATGIGANFTVLERMPSGKEQGAERNYGAS